MFMHWNFNSDLKTCSVPYGGSLPMARAIPSPATMVCSRSAGESPYTTTDHMIDMSCGKGELTFQWQLCLFLVDLWLQRRFAIGA